MFKPTRTTVLAPVELFWAADAIRTNTANTNVDAATVGVLDAIIRGWEHIPVVMHAAASTLANAVLDQHGVRRGGHRATCP